MQRSAGKVIKKRKIRQGYSCQKEIRFKLCWLHKSIKALDFLFFLICPTIFSLKIRKCLLFCYFFPSNHINVIVSHEDLEKKIKNTETKSVALGLTCPVRCDPLSSPRLNLKPFTCLQLPCILIGCSPLPCPLTVYREII